MFISSTERRLLNLLTQSFFIVKCEEHITFIMYIAEIKSIPKSDTVHTIPDFLLIITPDVIQMETKRTQVRLLAAATIPIMYHILSSTCLEVLFVAV